MHLTLVFGLHFLSMVIRNNCEPDVNAFRGSASTAKIQYNAFIHMEHVF